VIKKGIDNVTPTNQANSGKHSLLIAKGAQSPISTAKLPQYSNGQTSQTTISSNANINMNINMNMNMTVQNENMNNNIAGNSSMIPMRVNSGSHHDPIPLNFNH
jgi:hypothetical protein